MPRNTRSSHPHVAYLAAITEHLSRLPPSRNYTHCSTGDRPVWRLPRQAVYDAPLLFIEQRCSMKLASEKRKGPLKEITATNIGGGVTLDVGNVLLRRRPFRGRNSNHSCRLPSPPRIIGNCRASCGWSLHDARNSVGAREKPGELTRTFSGRGLSHERRRRINV